MGEINTADNDYIKFYEDTTRIRTVSAYLYTVIDGPENYVKLVNLLGSLTERDELNLYINTPGGRVDSTCSILHAIKECKGKVTAIADGDVMSAGSILFFACPNKTINEYAQFMIHGVASGEVGKLNKIKRANDFGIEQMKKLFRDVYSPYFTKKEIDEFCESESDFYFDSEEIKTRIEK